MGCTQTKLKELEGGSFKVQHQTKSYVHRKSVKQAACNMPGQLHESMLLLHSTSDDKNGGKWRDDVKIEQKYSIEGSSVLGEGLCGKVRIDCAGVLLFFFSLFLSLSLSLSLSLLYFMIRCASLTLSCSSLPPAPSPLPPPSLIRSFSLQVVTAVHLKTKRKYACKILALNRIDNERLEELRREIRIMMKLDHPVRKKTDKLEITYPPSNGERQRERERMITGVSYHSDSSSLFPPSPSLAHSLSHSLPSTPANISLPSINHPTRILSNYMKCLKNQIVCISLWNFCPGENSLIILRRSRTTISRSDGQRRWFALFFTRLCIYMQREYVRLVPFVICLLFSVLVCEKDVPLAFLGRE